MRPRASLNLLRVIIMTREKRKLSEHLGETAYYDNKENNTKQAIRAGESLRKKLTDRTNTIVEPPSRKSDLNMMNEEKIKKEPGEVSPYFNQTPNDIEDSVLSPKKSKWEPPNWLEQFHRIRDMRSSMSAPVDSMGCDSLANLDPTLPPKTKRFHTLVALMLSAQTKDEVTARAAMELAKLPLDVQTILKTDEDVIAKAIYPVSFYKRKAQYIKKTAQILKDSYDEDIPESVEELCKLPGVGPKMAYLTMASAWKKNVGIGVDTHVHRISNRLGWTRATTKTPEHTRKELEDWLPQEYWQEVNHLLVGFGQQTCRPVGPKCGECKCKDICPTGVAQTRSKSSKLKSTKIEKKSPESSFD